MTNQEIIDLAAQFDLITFGPQDLVYFAREIEARTIARCAKVCEDSINNIGDEAIIGDLQRTTGINVCTNLASAIRALGDDDE